MTSVETFDVDPSDFSDVPDTADDNKVTCPDCNGRYTLTKAGVIRSHNCNGVKTVSRSTAKGTAKRGGKKSKTVPGNVTKIGSAALASGIEFGVSRLIAQAVPCSPSEVPAGIPDDDVETMIGPIVKLLWPNIPARAQSVISAVCDQEDLILCALAWMEYGQKLSAWTKAAHELKAQQTRETGDGNGIAGQNQQGGNYLGYGNGPTIVPFVPASESAV